MAPAVKLAPVSPARTPDTTEALLRELAEGQRALEQRIAALEAIGRSRDAADAVLRRQLADSTRGLAFRAADLLRHARVDEALAAALRHADVTTTADIGCWLRGRGGIEDGMAVVRLRGRRWQVRHIMCSG